MTPEQALQILTAATAAVHATRDQHTQIIQALNTLKELVGHHDQPKSN